MTRIDWQPWRLWTIWRHIVRCAYLCPLSKQANRLLFQSHSPMMLPSRSALYLFWLMHLSKAVCCSPRPCYCLDACRYSVLKPALPQTLHQLCHPLLKLCHPLLKQLE
ncbi:hypothetical protein ACQKWADRAFT_210332 [Trichoderma austrokoningii]